VGDLVSRLKTEGPQLWRQLSGFQRATLIAVAIATLGAILYLTQWAQQPEYSAVFTGLADSDASAIVAKLKEQKIPYELADGGATVRVPSDKVYDVRLQLVSLGLPKGSIVGYELFDKSSFGLSDFAQRLNYQRALEGELARTITRISGVQDARVHIVMPQSELFAAQEKPATASVVLTMKTGMQPDGKQVQGISTLVARSVEGLTPANVTIVDGSGTLLSGDSSSMAFSGTGTNYQTDAQRNFELTRQRDIQGMLEQVLGPRKAVVRVSAVLDWNQYESTTETYSPTGQPTQVRSSQEVVESSTVPLGSVGSGIPTYPLDTRNPAGPVVPNPLATPGPTAQPNGTVTPATPTALVLAAATAEPQYTRRETTTNYEISKLNEKTVKTPGSLKRQSISVMLDGQVDDATVSTVTKAVAAAAGVDESRGDTISVSSMPFDQAAAAADQQTQKDADQRNWYLDIARYVVAALSIIVVLLLVRSLVRGLTGAGRKPKTVVALPDGNVRATAVAGAPVRAALPPANDRQTLAQGEVTELAKNQPKLVAGIIKTWLDEREPGK
jgi:flagellar M-ring protein FliF